MRRILRHVISVDDQWHEFDVRGNPHYEVACRRPGEVDLWLDVDTSPLVPVLPCWFRVYGTGHELPDGPRWIGTALDGGLVWHVLATDADPTTEGNTK